MPTPLRKTKDPDLSYVVSAVEMMRRHLHPGVLVVLESTTYPGTTEEVVQPILEKGGLKAGQDFFLAFSPERVDPGNEKWNTKNVPKIVGGLTPACSSLAKALYGASIDTVIEVSSPKVAEMVKLLENTFRAVNIGLVNELALMCDRLGLSVWEVVDAAATKPFGFMPFYPGPGLGGHCIPIDPFYLSWKVKEVGFERGSSSRRAVNGAMLHRVVDKVTDAPNSHSALCAARTCSRSIRSATSMTCVSRRRSTSWPKEAEGARSAITTRAATFPARDWPGAEDLGPWRSPQALERADRVVIVTDHKVLDYKTIVERAKLIGFPQRDQGCARARVQTWRTGGEVGRRNQAPGHRHWALVLHA